MKNKILFALLIAVILSIVIVLIVAFKPSNVDQNSLINGELKIILNERILVFQ